MCHFITTTGLVSLLLLVFNPVHGQKYEPDHICTLLKDYNRFKDIGILSMGEAVNDIDSINIYQAITGGKIRKYGDKWTFKEAIAEGDHAMRLDKVDKTEVMNGTYHGYPVAEIQAIYNIFKQPSSGWGRNKIGQLVEGKDKVKMLNLYYPNEVTFHWEKKSPYVEFAFAIYYRDMVSSAWNPFKTKGMHEGCVFHQSKFLVQICSQMFI